MYYNSIKKKIRWLKYSTVVMVINVQNVGKEFLLWRTRKKFVMLAAINGAMIKSPIYFLCFLY